MCDYCKNQKTMLKTEVVNPNMVRFCDIEPADIQDVAYTVGVFIDNRGFLRLVDLEDCSCIDGGQRIKIHFCPNCGEKIKQTC